MASLESKNIKLKTTPPKKKRIKNRGFKENRYRNKFPNRPTLFDFFLLNYLKQIFMYVFTMYLSFLLGQELTQGQFLSGA